MGKNNISASITLEDNQIRNSLKVLNSNLKMLDSQLKLSGNSVDDLAQDYTKASAQMDTYRAKIDVLKQKQQEYLKQIDLEKQKLQSNTTERTRLTNAIEDQKQKIAGLTTQYGKNSNEVKEAETELTKLQTAFTRVDSAITKSNVSINNLNTAYNKAESEIGQTTNKMNTLSTAMNNVQNASSSANTNLNSTNTAMNNVSNSTANATTQAHNLSNAFKGMNFTNVINSIQGGLSTLSNGLNRVNTVGVNAVKSIFQVGSDFEVGMSNWKALTSATGDEFKIAEDKARELGATTKYTAKDGADALSYMALAGLNIQTQLDSASYVLSLANVGMMDLATSADLVTDSMAAFGLASADSATYVKNLERYTDALAQTQRKSNTTAQQLMEAYIGAGGMFVDVNTSIEESMALLGSLANMGTKGSEAGTALNSLLTNLKATTSSAIEGFQQLGIEVYNADGSYKGYEAVIREIAKVLPTLTDEQEAFAKTLIGGKTQMDTLNALVTQMANGGYDSLKEAVKGASGALNEMDAIMTDNLDNQVKNLDSYMEELQIKVYKVLTPMFKDLFVKANEFLDKIYAMDDGQIKMIANLLKFSLALGVVVKVLSGLTGIVGSFSGAYINLMLLMGKGSTLLGGVATATTGVATATAGATTAVAGTTTAVAGATGVFATLGTTLLAVAPYVIALVGAFALVRYAVKKGTEESIKDVDTFADRTVTAQKKIININGDVANSAEETTVKISEATKERLSKTLEYTDNMQKILEEGFLNQNNLSRDEYEKMVKLKSEFDSGVLTSTDTTAQEELRILEERFNAESEMRSTNKTKMIEQINLDKEETLKQLEAKHADEIQKTQEFLSTVLGMTEEQISERINKLKEGQEQEVKGVEETTSTLLTKVEEYYGNRQVITDGQTQELNELIARAEEQKVNLLSESSAEALAVTGNLYEAQKYQTAEAMGAEIKALEDARLEKENIAQIEYENRLKTLQQLYYDEGVLTDEQYKTALEKIATDRNNQIIEANKTKEDKLKVLEEYNKGVYDSLDKNTGEVRQKYQIWLEDFGTFVRGYNEDNAEASNKAVESIQKAMDATGEVPDYTEKKVQFNVTGWEILKELGLSLFSSTPIYLPLKIASGGRSLLNDLNGSLYSSANLVNVNNNSRMLSLENKVNTLSNAISSIPMAVREAVQNVRVNNVIGDTNIKVNVGGTEITKTINNGLYVQKKEEDIFKGK